MMSKVGGGAVRIAVSHAHAEGTLVRGTSRGDGTAELLRSHGLRWSRTLGAWYVPRSRDTLARPAVLEAIQAGLAAAGFDVVVTVDNARRPTAEVRQDWAERSSLRAEVLAERSERLAVQSDAAEAAARAISARIPLGQPVLVGHHSQRRHERDLDCIGKNWARAAAQEADSRQASRRASESRARARELSAPSPQFAARRLREVEAECRRISRELTANPVAAEEWRARMVLRRDQLLEQLEYWRGQVGEGAAAGKAITAEWGRANIRPGDLVRFRSRWLEVVRVNRVSVTVPSSLGQWNDTLRMDQIDEHRPGPGTL